MSLWQVLIAVVATAAAQSCHFGSHCPSSATCCRNSLGEALVDSPGFGHFGKFPNAHRTFPHGPGYFE